MNTSYDSDNDLQGLHDSTGDREISLGTSMILGIFFALALLCAVFFGFGYSMGRRSAQSQAQPPARDQSTGVDAGGPKPSSGSLAGQSLSSSDSANNDALDREGDAPLSTATRVNAALESKAQQPSKSEPDSSMDATVSSASPDSGASSATASNTSPIAGRGSLFVQVAAVSHPEDAEALVNALKKRGYSVTIRQQPQDKLLHVQIGPFANKKDAGVMQQRLLTDGYNAIVK